MSSRDSNLYPLYLARGPDLPMQIAVDFYSVADFDGLKLREGEVAPLGIIEIVVQDGVAEEEVSAVVLGYVPVATADEEMQVDGFVAQGDVFILVESGYLLQLGHSRRVPHDLSPLVTTVDDNRRPEVDPPAVDLLVYFFLIGIRRSFIILSFPAYFLST